VRREERRRAHIFGGIRLYRHRRHRRGFERLLRQHHFDNIDTFKRIVSALIAVLIWPLILLGLEVHIN
jgi:hypothetical protein